MRHLHQKIEDKTLEIQDIFDLFPDTEIRVSIMGSDSLSGAKKVFTQVYKASAVKTGKFGEGLNFVTF